MCRQVIEKNKILCFRASFSGACSSENNERIPLSRRIMPLFAFTHGVPPCGRLNEVWRDEVLGQLALIKKSSDFLLYSTNLL